MNTSLKLGYFADGPWAHGALALLLEDPSISISFICARADNPDPYLRQQAEAQQIDFLVEPNINSATTTEAISKYDCDLFVSMSFNQIFRKHLYSLPRLGTINCHAGCLPKYRGRNILNWVLINDEKEFGITVHYVDDGVDTGDIIIQHLFPITDTDDYNSLLATAHTECPKILYQAICDIRDDKVQRIPQTTLPVSPLICSQRITGDETIDWSLTSREIFCFVRSLVPPGPCAITTFQNIPVRITMVELVTNAPVYKGIPGAILAKVGTAFLVKTGDTYIKIVEWSSEVPLRAGGRFK